MLTFIPFHTATRRLIFRDRLTINNLKLCQGSMGFLTACAVTWQLEKQEQSGGKAEKSRGCSKESEKVKEKAVMIWKRRYMEQGQISWIQHFSYFLLKSYGFSLYYLSRLFRQPHWKLAPSVRWFTLCFRADPSLHNNLFYIHGIPADWLTDTFIPGVPGCIFLKIMSNTQNQQLTGEVVENWPCHVLHSV